MAVYLLFFFSCSQMLQQLDGAKWRSKLPVCNLSLTRPDMPPSSGNILKPKPYTPPVPSEDEKNEELFKKNKAEADAFVKKVSKEKRAVLKRDMQFYDVT